MINRIQIEKLFGLYNYDIHFLDNPAVKILTGPNGYGKTTILLALNHLYKGDFWFFHFLVFDKIVVTLTNQVIVIVRQSENSHESKHEDLETGKGDDFFNVADDTDAERYEERISLLDIESHEIESFTINNDYIQQLIYTYRRRNIREPSNYGAEELLTRFYDATDDDYIQKCSKNISLAIQEYETKYLPAQRVYNNIMSSQAVFRTPRISSSRYEIDHVNEEISRLYRRTQNFFAATSQRIDATFISRLIKRKESYTREELQYRLSALKKRIDGYKELNLFANMELLDYSLDDDGSYQELKKALSLYVDDMNAKMDRFEELYQKISLYKRVVSEKILSEKSVDFSENGFTVKNINGLLLNDLHKLSSGEQNLLILYYNLIFKSNSKTVLLIDEPENSLHVAWQSKMLNDYVEMAKTTGCQIILATHSPTFIDGHWEMTTDLYRQYKGRAAE